MDDDSRPFFQRVNWASVALAALVVAGAFAAVAMFTARGPAPTTKPGDGEEGPRRPDVEAPAEAGRAVRVRLERRASAPGMPEATVARFGDAIHEIREEAPAALVDAIARAHADHPLWKVAIEAEEAVPRSDVMKVFNALLAAGVTEIVLDSAPARESDTRLK